MSSKWNAYDASGLFIFLVNAYIHADISLSNHGNGSAQQHTSPYVSMLLTPVAAMSCPFNPLHYTCMMVHLFPKTIIVALIADLIFLKLSLNMLPYKKHLGHEWQSCASIALDYVA